METPNQSIPVPPLQLQGTEPNLIAGAAAGGLTAVVSAVLWAGITAVTEYQIGFMAIGVGLAVGFVVRSAGGGTTVPFRLVATVLALLGCVLGNLLVGCVFYAQAEEVGILRVLEVLDIELARDLLQATFQPIDLLFYGLAVWEAWRLRGTQPTPVSTEQG